MDTTFRRSSSLPDANRQMDEDASKALRKTTGRESGLVASIEVHKLHQEHLCRIVASFCEAVALRLRAGKPH
jgi:hypothetical protein